MRLLTTCLLLTVPALAQDAERALLVVDPDNAESRYVANYYLEARGIPSRNVLYMDPAAANYPAWADVQLPGFLGALGNAGIEDTVDFVILPPGDDFYVSAPGLISDTCFAVNRFATPSCFTLARQSEDILSATLNSQATNQYRKNGYISRAFQSELAWFDGVPSEGNSAERYYLGAMLGWTGQNGNTLQEVLDMIDRSVAVDGTHPVGTFYFMQTNDDARSSPRHDAYPGAVDKIVSLGGQAQHLFDNLPLGNHDCMGVMTGLANPDIFNTGFTVLPGSFCDHLTSFAGTFNNNSQTKMSEWITKGASGSAGTVEEPCNYSGKFPAARMHVVYFKGLSLGEAWFRSMGFKPFQTLFMGDPLTRPYGDFPTVDVPAPPVGPQTGVITITPSSSATSGGKIEEQSLFVDGVLIETIGKSGDFQLDTTTIADGWHDLRVRAVDNKNVRNQSSWKGGLEVDNHAGDVTASASTTSGDLGTLFDVDHVASGGTVVEVVLIQHERVVAASDQATGTLSVYGQNLGAGTVTVQAEARFDDGSRARSAPVTLDVAYSGGGVAGTPPVSASFTQWVMEDRAFVVNLPAVCDDDPATVTTTVLTGPAQSTLLGGTGSWRVYEPSPTALGSDTLTYEVTGAGGTSTTGTVTIVYEDVDGCVPVTSYCVSTANSVGDGADIGYTGTVSIAANDLTLTVSEAVPGQAGIFIQGMGQVQNPAGDGFLCIGSGIVRFPALAIDANGMASQVIDYGAPPHVGGTITVGSTWDFQFWYRDPAAGGAGSNFSDALEATFCD